MLTHWFQYGTNGQHNAAQPQLEITELNPDSVYTLKMTGSFTLHLTFELNPIRYTVTGASSYGHVDVNGDFNTTNGAVFNNIAPDASGIIKVYVNTISTTNVASICGIQIIRGRTSGPVPAVSLSNPVNNDVLPVDGNITIAATASEGGGSITKVEFYADTTKIGEDSTAPYNMTLVSPKPGKYTITARAVDGFGNINTATINITIQSLGAFWSTTGSFHLNPDSNFVGNGDSVRLAFRTNNQERMSISPTGNIGIGVDTPTAQLHTTGTVRLAHYKNDTSGASVLTTDTSGNLMLSPMKFSNGLVKTGDTIGLGGTIDAGKFGKAKQFRLGFTDTMDSASSASLYYSANNLGLVSGFFEPGKDAQGSSLVLSAQRSTDNPLAPLQGFVLQNSAWVFTGAILSNQARISGIAADSTVGSDLYFLTQDQAGLCSIDMHSQKISIISPAIQFVNFPNNAAGDSVLTTDITGNLKLKSISSFTSTGQWKLSGGTTFDSLDNIGIGISNTQGNKLAVIGASYFSGNVGIGTAVPQSKLAVNGTITALQIKVTPTGWPDSVFNKRYPLLPLPALQAYLEKNKHLPGVISEQEVIDKGQDLGKNQVVLLQKVEELTLYVIELDKKVEQLKRENELLKRKCILQIALKTNKCRE